MDHWGDPWADDADTNTNIAAPAKVAHSPLRTPTHESSINKPAPIVLNGFLDDAGWGSNEWIATPSPRKDADGFRNVERAVINDAQDWDADSTRSGVEEIKTDESYEGSGAWAVQPAKADDDIHTPTNIRVNDWDDTPNWNAPTTGIKEGDLRDESHDATNDWGGLEEAQSVKSVEHGHSESSDTATTAHADDVSTEASKDATTSVHPEDDTSTRSSVSQSEESHNEPVLESPRTSVEEERMEEESTESTNNEEKIPEEVDKQSEQQESSESDGEDDFGDFEEETDQAAGVQPSEGSAVDQQESTFRDDEVERSNDALDTNSVAPAKPLPISTDSFILDPQLMAELFAPVKAASEPEDPPDDPVSSTSTRKAWYRLTRKQTMREYNNGALDDNYIRITWKTSHIRTEVNKTIVRWANEDRIAGRGPGARASFFWDSTAAPDTKAHVALHARNRSSIAGSKPVQPVREALPQLSTDIPAAFNWSSPLSATQMTPDGSGARVASAPVTAKHSAVTRLQRQGGRAASVDLSPRPREPASHKRTSTATDFQTRVASPVHASPITPIQAPPRDNFDPWSSSTTSSPVIPISAGPPTPAEAFDPWANLGALDTNPPPTQDNANVEDEDDDWGDMVESPAVSTVQTPISNLHTPIAELSGSTASNAILASATPATPKPVGASLIQATSPPSGPSQASRIVRLQGTVSPTSALFKPNALVPTDSQERIGPHLLKKTNRSREGTPERTTPVPVQVPSMNEVLAQEPTKKEAVKSEPATPPATATITPVSASTPEVFPVQNEVQPEPAPAIDASLPKMDDQPDWGNDADFSIFESALPTAPVTAPTTTQPDPSDPWSIFNTPVPAEPPAPFSRPAPRPVTPPALQPLTSATSSAQKRKAEEDKVVRSIVEGLPDLRYMLRK